MYLMHLPCKWLVLFALLMIGPPSTFRPAFGLVDQLKDVAEEAPQYQPVQLAGSLEFPWSFAFLPDFSIIITERMGHIQVLAPGQPPRRLRGVPAVLDSGHGGLLDVAPDPRFRENRMLYLSYVHGNETSSTIRVTRARLNRAQTRLLNHHVIFERTPASQPELFGGRMVVTDDGHLYLTLGDRREPELAQDLRRHHGSIIRIRTDGSVPRDNPFVSLPEAQPEIWSFGHRNPQGLAIHPITGQLWSHEHGPKGGDELNLILPGGNYGWPVITHGIDYSGAPIGEEKEKEGMERPVRYWSPAIAPSGLAITGAGNTTTFWVGALAGQAVVSIEMRNSIIRERRLFERQLGRVRDVRIGPDRLLYVLTDGPAAALYRLEPALEQAGGRAGNEGG